MVLIVCVGCTRQPLYTGKPFPATAVVNQQNWYGAPQAVKIPQDSTGPCTINKFALFIQTDLPYKASALLASRFETPTGCVPECTKTQMLSIDNIPLKKGKYRVKKLDKCGSLMPDYAHHTLVLPRVGSALVAYYRRMKNRPNWIRITHYDKQTNTIEGQFALSLEKIRGKYPDRDSTENQFIFRDGKFKAELKRALLLGDGKPK